MNIGRGRRPRVGSEVADLEASRPDRLMTLRGERLILRDHPEWFDACVRRPAAGGPCCVRQCRLVRPFRGDVDWWALTLAPAVVHPWR